ncbi:MAG: hypothetical protein ACYTFT_05955, partial [Planctomycetota bacterium]
MAAKFGPFIDGLEVGKTYKAVVPQKLKLGGKVKGTKQPGLFRVYVPTRDGGKLTLETTAGEIQLMMPDGKPAPAKKGSKVEFEVPIGTFGWFGVMVTGSASYEVSSTFVIEGAAKDKDGSMLVPWHFFYFPFTEAANGPAKRWDEKFGTKADAFETASFWKSEIESGGRTGGG